MKFNLVRPCADCPFRSDIAGYLRAERAEEIADIITDGDGSFSCHKTNLYDEGYGEMVETAKSQHCAGALIFLEKQDNPNQLMRVAERIGVYDRHKLDMSAPVFDNADDFIGAQEK